VLAVSVGLGGMSARLTGIQKFTINGSCKRAEDRIRGGGTELDAESGVESFQALGNCSSWSKGGEKLKALSRSGVQGSELVRAGNAMPDRLAA
jgi:hypothetical protein